jgi:hypothetical protein
MAFLEDRSKKGNVGALDSLGWNLQIRDTEQQIKSQQLDPVERRL